MNIWTQTRYFKKGENWGEPEKMNGAFVLTLDLVRHYFKSDQRFIIHCGCETAGHKINGDHPRGEGVDCHIENIGIKAAYEKLIEVFDLLQLNNFVSLGVYPEWYSPGFHIGLRGYKARWCKLGGEYLAIERAFK